MVVCELELSSIDMTYNSYYMHTTCNNCNGIEKNIKLAAFGP